MEILISGYYGFKNTGDEAILSSLVKGLKNLHPKIKITVLSKTPRDTSKKYAVKSINRLNIFKIVFSLLKCDVFISGGGGLLQDKTGKFTLFYYLGLVMLAKFFRKKVVILGQSFGPITKWYNKHLARHILNKVDLITVRDALSIKLLETFNINKPSVFQCADLALLLEKETIIEIIKTEKIFEFEKPVVGVSIRAFKEMPDDFVYRIAEVLDEITKRYNVEILFIPFKYPDDTEFSVAILEQMHSKGRVLEGEYSPEQILGIVGTLDFLIGCRLHSLIFAALENVPSLGISYDPKVKAFCDEADIICLDPDVSKKSFLEKFESVFSKKLEYKARLSKNLPILKEKSRLNFIKLKEFLCINDSISILGVRIDNVSFDRAIKICDEYIKSQTPHLIFTPNPEIIVEAQKNQRLKEVLNSADLNIPDGIGILFAARFLKTPLKERLTGIDLMLGLFDLAKQKDYKIFLLGGKYNVAEAVAKNYQSLNIVGTHHGYFKDDENEKIVELIRSKKPDILFVGLGSPKQEMWLYENYKKIGAPLNMVVGGSFDVLSGIKKRAPKILQKIGLEWLYRLIQEPKRWRRQLNLLQFLRLVIKNGKRDNY